MRSLRETLNHCNEAFAELFIKQHNAPTRFALVLVGWQLARLLTVKLVEEELSRRAEQPTPWPCCPECGGLLSSKGQKSRQLLTLIGTIKWKRRCGRCTSGCRLGQIAPLDEELGYLIKKVAIVSNESLALWLYLFHSR